MAENEVKHGHLYYPRNRNVPGDRLNTLAQRVGPTRFSPAPYGFHLDSAGIGLWNADEIARLFRPAPEIGSDWASSKSSTYRRILSASESLIVTEHDCDFHYSMRSSYEPGAFFDSFQPAPITGG